jgi:hypothetical protein
MNNQSVRNIKQDDDLKRMIVIEPVVEHLGNGIAATGSYKVYKSSVDKLFIFFAEKLDVNKKNDHLAYERNPKYLGDFAIEATGAWHYQGNLLKPWEQEHMAKHIKELISS